MKGVILAGGHGTRLLPLTKVISKQLLPIFDKPLIYYPITTLILAGIQDILIITTPNDRELFEKAIGNGSQWGIRICFATQTEAKGIPNGLLLAEEFVGNDRFFFILGDNLFYGTGLGRSLASIATAKSTGGPNEIQNSYGCDIFTYPVKDPENFGIVTLDDNLEVISLEEKPTNSTSNNAIVGMYIFDNLAFEYTKTLHPSSRGELEIVDLISKYLKTKKLNIHPLGRGTAWLDTGTFSNMHDASTFIRIIQERQGVKIGDPLEAAQVQGWIN